MVLNNLSTGAVGELELTALVLVLVWGNEFKNIPLDLN